MKSGTTTMLATMHRKKISLTGSGFSVISIRPGRGEWMRRRAARTGARQSDLVRRSVDLLLESEKESSESWREATRAAVGMWKDRDPAEFDALREALRARFGGTDDKR